MEKESSPEEGRNKVALGGSLSVDSVACRVSEFNSNHLPPFNIHTTYTTCGDDNLIELPPFSRLGNCMVEYA